MKPLLKISLDQTIGSLTPIISWFLLSLLVDKDLINVFSLTYPLQFVYSTIQSVFITGANISQTRDHNRNAVMSGFAIGIPISLFIYGLAAFNVDSFITFMNMNPNTYRTFAVYSIVILATQTVLAFILGKLYYENQNTRANRYSITFYLLNFSVLIGTALVSKNQYVIAGTTGIIMILYTTFLLLQNCSKFRLHLNLLHCIKYDSAAFVSSVISFFIQLFGLSHAFQYGPEYSLAITFIQLITDTQWDVLESVRILASIDITQHRFNLKKSLHNSYKLLVLLFASSAIMFLCLHHFYNLDLGLTALFLTLELLDFALSPSYYLYTAILQLNWSSGKVAANKFIARFARLLCTSLPTPFCNNIGAIFASVYQIITTRYLLYKNFTVNKSGKIRKRPAKKSLSPSYRYNDIPIDE